MRWFIVLILLPALAWCVVYATFSATGFEAACLRALDVDTPPIACAPTWFLFGAAGCILLFQWGMVMPLAVWLQRRVRRDAAVATAARQWLTVGTLLVMGAALARAVLVESESLMPALYATVGQFCLPFVVLIIPTVLLFSRPSAPAASDTGAGVV